jgi:hypothetical protein
MEALLNSLIVFISELFGSMYAKSPAVWGSQYPAFLAQVLLLIVIIDLVIFGWRPLVRKFFPSAYGGVDYGFGQVTNLLWLVLLVGFMIYLGAELGEAWGKFMGISTMLWSTIGIVALLFLGRLVTKRSK